MASADVMAHFEMRALRESHEARMDAQNAKYNLLLWLVGALLALGLLTAFIPGLS